MLALVNRGRLMNMRNFAIAIIASAVLGGCVTGYGYRGGAGDYYYGRPSGDYYGYGAPYGSVGYGYSGYGYLGHGYGYDYGYPYGYGGYYPGYYYPRYGYHPRPRSERPPPPRDGYVFPDNGVRYPSRYQTLVRGKQLNNAQVQGIPGNEPRYQSRYQPGVPQMRSGLEGRSRSIQPNPPSRMQRAAPRFESPAPRAEPRFESRAPRGDLGGRELAPMRSSSRERDRGRVQTP